jgi:hypothetical protein
MSFSKGPWHFRQAIVLFSTFTGTAGGWGLAALAGPAAKTVSVIKNVPMMKNNETSLVRVKLCPFINLLLKTIADRGSISAAS